MNWIVLKNPNDKRWLTNLGWGLTGSSSSHSNAKVQLLPKPCETHGNRQSGLDEAMQIFNPREIAYAHLLLELVVSIK
jgi:hypothetical protein